MRVIEISQGKFAIVDEDDFDRVAQYRWTFDGGYAHRRACTPSGVSQKIYMHRFIVGDACAGKEVDHHNGNRLDNRKENLRICTRQQNAKNVPRSTRNKSGYKGVHWSKKNRNWVSQISMNGRMKHLGSFATPQLAYEAYKHAALQLHGEFANVGHN